MEPAGIRLVNVSAGYDDQVALDQASCEFALQRTTVIIGPGGSGKSTLLKLIADAAASPPRWYTGTIERPCAEPIMVGQRRPRARCRGDAPAVSPQQLRALWGEGSRDLLETLIDASAAPARDMSFETYRLLELTAALAEVNRCVLLDEPTAGLSADARAAVCELLVRARGSRTIIIVSHDLAFTRTVADDVVFLLDGAVVESGTAQKIFENPAQERTRAMIRWGA